MAVESSNKINLGVETEIDQGEESVDAVTKFSDQKNLIGDIVAETRSISNETIVIAADSSDKIKDGIVAWMNKVENFTDTVTQSSNEKNIITDVVAGTRGISNEAMVIAAESSDKIKVGLVTGLDKSMQYTDTIVVAALAISRAVQSSASYQKAMATIRNSRAIVTSYEHLSRFDSNLNWTNVPGRALLKYRRAGVRSNLRSFTEAQEIWETIPKQIRAGGPETTANYLKGKDWSHIQAYSKGGSNAAWNGIFENASPNRSRGSRTMTAQEIKAAEAVLQSNAFHATLVETAKSAMKGGLTAGKILAVVAALEYGLQFQKGEITEDEFFIGIGKAFATAGIYGAAVSGLVTAMALAFPPIIPLLAPLSLPLAVIGFSVLAGKLGMLGIGWYEFYISEQPLRPIAFRHWIEKYESVKGKAQGVVYTDFNDIRHRILANWETHQAPRKEVGSLPPRP